MRFLMLAVLLAGCGVNDAPLARKIIREQHGPRIATLVLEDFQRHRTGLQRAADRVAAGFVKVQGAKQEHDMRQVLKLVRSPRKGIQELVISPMSFLGVVGADGVVIARDAEPDKMKGMNLGKDFEAVRKALAGDMSEGIGQFENPVDPGKPSITYLMAAPAHYDGKVVGGMVLGIPLWRMAQRLGKQLQMESAGKNGAVIWVYLFDDNRLHHHGTPPDLDKLVPDANARKQGLAKSPGGYTGSVQQFGYWYGYGVRPLRALGPGVGAIIFRMEPK